MKGKHSLCIVMAALALSACIFSQGCRRGGRETAEPAVEVRDSVPAMGFWPDSLLCEEGRVRPGETFSGLMVRLGMPSADVYALVDSLDSTFDVRKMRADKDIAAYYSLDTLPGGEVKKELRYVEYRKNIASSVIFRTTAPLGAWEYNRPVSNERKFAHVVISSNLWNDMKKAGSDPRLIATLSDIYAWTVDFFGLQEGDEFKVMYQQKVCDGAVVSVDTVFYAEFHRDDKVIPAVRFEVPGCGKYWKPDGESMKGAFLKAPLQFSRISSGFSYHRKHPVTGQVKAHTAVDYAAPTGTPVMSIGDGTVLSAGWAGGGGNMVKIRHNGGIYVTAYLHLSRFAKGIKAGTRVSQGQVIGYVGATGVATGPHLDFRVWKNGTPVNPLKIDHVPDPPLPEELRPQLDSVYKRYSAVMDSLTVNNHELL
ncbi:MAG: peptidoglycan DD-metalloendopeptidase family protein [Candidatus Cryptobacteroides sp.]